MEIIREIFSYISGLGNYVMIPIMITLVGLIVRLKPVNADSCRYDRWNWSNWYEYDIESFVDIY